MQTLALKATDVNKYFGGGFDARRLLPWCATPEQNTAHVLKGISLEVQKGEVFGLIGANGSGKSTLIRILSTLLTPDSGSVSVFGYDVETEAGQVRALINRVSADPSFFRNMSAYENLLFFGRVYGLTSDEIRTKVPDILERLGFETDKMNEPMAHLSRGQQQKIAVARSFLTSPVLMLLDEPTTGLDPRSKRDVQRFIQQVQRDHDATILLTTHDMEEAEILCDRISFIAGGKIVATGTSKELKEQVGNGNAETTSMDDVFMALTGKDIAEDEVPEEVMAR
ncbi:MAG: ABC transporter ATP-binding protein [Chloroflexota bacterium]